MLDSAGVALVINEPSGLRAAGHWEAGSVMLRLGQTDGTSPEAFHRVMGALYVHDEVVVADAGSGELRWFDNTGHHVATAGGVGDGPGEFRNLAWIGRGLHGEVLAWDSRLRRVSVFRDREFVFGVAPPFPEDRAFPIVHGALPDNEIVATPGAVYIPENEIGVQRPLMPIWITSLDGTDVKTVATYLGQAINLRPARNQGWIRTEVPFGATTLVTTVRDEIVIGDNAHYEFQHLRRDGQVERVVRVRHDPRVVTKEDLEAELERRLEAVPPVEEIRAGIRASFEETPPAESRPAFVALRGDTNGNVWIQRETDGPEWDVFDSEGTLIARMVIPRGLRVLDITQDFLLGVDQDELGVENVVLRRIIRNQ